MYKRQIFTPSCTLEYLQTIQGLHENRNRSRLSGRTELYKVGKRKSIKGDNGLISGTNEKVEAENSSAILSKTLESECALTTKKMSVHGLGIFILSVPLICL